MREKGLSIFLCIVGIFAVSYGMMKDNDAVFIIGLLFVIGAYVLIRKRLKESIGKRL